MSALVASALAFAKHGHAVLPLHYPVGAAKLVCSCGRLCGKNAAKHPYDKLAKKGVHSATLDGGVIKHWFGYLVPDANLGVACDRLVVLDIDPRHDGDQSLAALEQHECALPETWRTLTGGDGEHIIFSCPDGVTVKNYSHMPGSVPPLGPGIDIRASGGYIVAPPSRHISGRSYAWSVDHHPRDVPLAPAPPWLIERLNTSSNTKPRPPTDWVKLLTPASEYQDDVACSIAGHLFAFGCEYQVVLGLMRPWARESGLDQQKLEDIVDRIARKEAAKRTKRLAR